MPPATAAAPKKPTAPRSFADFEEIVQAEAKLRQAQSEAAAAQSELTAASAALRTAQPRSAVEEKAGAYLQTGELKLAPVGDRAHLRELAEKLDVLSEAVVIQRRAVAEAKNSASAVLRRAAEPALAADIKRAALLLVAAAKAYQDYRKKLEDLEAIGVPIGGCGDDAFNAGGGPFLIIGSPSEPFSTLNAYLGDLRKCGIDVTK